MSSTDPPDATSASQAEELSCTPPPNVPSETRFHRSSWFRNYLNIALGRMTPLGKSLYLHNKDLQNEASDCARCESQVSYLIAYSPTIRFLRSKMNALNGDMDESKVFCRRCPIMWNAEGEARYHSAGGVNMNHGIQICANWVRSQSHMEEVLAHEMVHAWDQLRFKVDEGNLKHSACTEIRASSLSGECRWTREFWTRSNWKVTQTHQDCVRKRAILSIRGRPNCESEAHATRTVDEVWDPCYADTRPFEEIYK